MYVFCIDIVLLSWRQIAQSLHVAVYDYGYSQDELQKENEGEPVGTMLSITDMFTE